MEPDEKRSLRAEWMPIESAPKDGTRILVSNGDDIGIAAYVTMEEWDYEEEPAAPGLFRKVLRERYYIWDETSLCGLSHWMPLPEPPTTGGA